MCPQVVVLTCTATRRCIGFACNLELVRARSFSRIEHIHSPPHIHLSLVGGYTARQTKVWTSQYRAAETETIQPIERLIEWLPDALPPDDDLTALVHGDLRVDNMIFAKGSPDVIAVLDWELSTLGHPATDVALATIA